MLKIRKQNNIIGYFLTVPYLFYTILFFAYPLLWSFWLFFHRTSIISRTSEFVGLENLYQALRSIKVFAAFIFTYKFIAIFIPVTIVISLFIALLINSLSKGKIIYIIGYFLPYLASGVSMSLIVRGMLSWNSPVSQFFNKIVGYTPDWFGNSTLAAIIIALMVSWKHSGYYALIFIAGLQSIPNEIYDAAKIDGVNFWMMIRKIIIPMLYPAFYTILILSTGLSFSIFGEPLILTGGGPHYATHSWQLEIYRQTFEFGNVGYGATIGVLDATVTFFTILLIKRLLKVWGKNYGWI